MKKIFFALCLFSGFATTGYAGGEIAHIFLAEQTLPFLPTPLKTLIENNLDAYLTGAVYPDSGYVAGAHYGEDSHWDPFIYTFSDYLKSTYPDFQNQNPKLTAFLFGCAAHRLSDEIMHRVFYDVMKEKDFDGNHTKAHSYGDMGIDLLLEMDQYKHLTLPKTEWVPVSDLSAIYQRMGKNQYTETEIRWGSTVLYFALLGEKIISPFAYPFLEKTMPWTASHYMNWPQGGIQDDAQETAAYQIKIWNYLLGLSNYPIAKNTNNDAYNEKPSAFAEFATEALQNNIIALDVKHQSDGSVKIENPVTKNFMDFEALIATLIKKITS